MQTKIATLSVAEAVMQMENFGYTPHVVCPFAKTTAKRSVNVDLPAARMGNIAGLIRP